MKKLLKISLSCLVLALFTGGCSSVDAQGGGSGSPAAGDGEQAPYTKPPVGNGECSEL